MRSSVLAAAASVEQTGPKTNGGVDVSRTRLRGREETGIQKEGGKRESVSRGLEVRAEGLVLSLSAPQQVSPSVECHPHPSVTPPIRHDTDLATGLTCQQSRRQDFLVFTCFGEMVAKVGMLTFWMVPIFSCA